MSIDFIKSIYYEFLSYFVTEKTKYKIKGECSKCGECCRQIRCYGLKNEKELKFMSIIFPYYKNFYIYDKDNEGNLILSCKHLKNNLCEIYDKRPHFCRNYPRKEIKENMVMLEGCSYSIIKKNFKDYLN